MVPPIICKLLVSGREVIALDSTAHAKRYAEDRFRRLRHSQAIIKWEPRADGAWLLTYRLPVQPTGDFFTTGYLIVEAGVTA